MKKQGFTLYIYQKNNNMKPINILLVSLCFILFSCSKDVATSQSNDKAIVSFQVYNYDATIDEYEKSIYLTLPIGSNLNEIEPTIKISRKATISPASGVTQDFSNPIIYTVQAEDGSKQQYTVNIALTKSSLARIESFAIDGVKGRIKDNWTTINHTEGNSIQIWLSGVSDVTNLKPIIEVSKGAKVYPASDIEVDFSRPVIYTVTAEDGGAASYAVGVQYEKFPSGLLYVTSMRNTNKSNGITTHYNFDLDCLSRIKSFTKTTNPFYIEGSLVDGDIVNILYDDRGKITQLIFDEKKDNAVINTRTLNISYPNNKTVLAIEQLAGGNTKKDIITLNDKGKVSKFETGSKTVIYTYDNYDNLIEQATANHGYKKISYDSYNSIFAYLSAPHWILLYTTEELIGSGTNNPTSIRTYKQNGELIEDIGYNYSYDSRTRYPRTYNYQSEGEEFKGIVFLKYVFPFSLNFAY